MNEVIAIPRPNVMTWKYLNMNKATQIKIPQTYLYHILRFVDYSKIYMIIKNRSIRNAIRDEQIVTILDRITDTRTRENKKYRLDNKKYVDSTELNTMRMHFRQNAGRFPENIKSKVKNFLHGYPLDRSFENSHFVDIKYESSAEKKCTGLTMIYEYVGQ